MIRTLHEVNAYALIASNAVAGLVCLLAHWRSELPRRPVWGIVIAAQLTTFVQVVVGILLINEMKIDPPRFHMLYGFSAIFSVGILYAYRPQLKGREMLLYGLGSLFIMGLGIRALFV